MTVGRVLLGTAVAAAVTLWPSVPAAAHTQAIASWPASGQVVTALPARVSVAYSTEVLPGVRVEIVAPDGSTVGDGEPAVVGQVVTRALDDTGQPGVYTALFDVVGSDGHAVSGSYEFTVDPEGVATDNPAGPEPDLGPERQTSVANVDPPEVDDESGSTTTVLLAGLAGAAVLAVLLRLVARRRRG